MRCPFLREAQVKFCQASAFKKMIVRTEGQAGEEKCSSPEYMSCPAAKQAHEERPHQSHCPFLQESLVQYCSAAPVTKFIPYSEAAFSHCGNESHRYCEFFQAIAHPEENCSDDRPQSLSVDSNCQRDCWVDGIRVPGRLSYSPNHMWMDVGDDGGCHIGIDGFLARVLERIERLSFLTAKGGTLPTAVLCVRDVDLQMVFPLRLQITGTNAYLRANPEKIISHPYSSGWLFEGRRLESPASRADGVPQAGLLAGQRAVAWMEKEVRRMTDFVQERLAGLRLDGKTVMADGGSFSRGLVAQLEREDILKLYNEFFSPIGSWRTSA